MPPFSPDDVAEELRADQYAELVARMTPDEVQAEYIRRRAQAIIIDARNDTSFEHEITRLVGIAYPVLLTVDQMRGELEDTGCLNQPGVRDGKDYDDG